MPAVFIPPFSEPRIPDTGRVIKVHRRPGHYAGDGDPVVDVAVGPHTVTLCAPFAGKIMLCREVGYTVQRGERVFETTSVGTPTWEIFVAYRRADAPGHAGRVGERLATHFGPGQVFKDIESLALGDTFARVIRERLQTAFVMVVIIGPHWVADARLHDGGDLHREEIRTALERGIHVVPVLVDNASMPRPEALPKDIRPLVERFGIALLETYWEAGIDKLIQNLEPVLEASPRRVAFLKQVPPWDYSGWMYVEDSPPLDAPTPADPEETK